MKEESFHILLPRKGEDPMGSLQAQWEDLLVTENCGVESLLQARLYLSDSANWWPVWKQHPLVRTLEATGVFGYVEQPPLCGVKAALLVWFMQGTHFSREVVAEAESLRACVEVDGMQWVVQSVRLDDADCREADSYTQTVKAFAMHKAVLARYGMSIEEHCQRTWIFVRDVDRNYAGVVAGRNAAFKEEGLLPETHFIASTGIGGATACRDALVAMDFLSVKGLSRDKVHYLRAPEYLNATSEYGVAFERGTALDLPSGRHYFISGTASIDKYGQCLHRGEVCTQAGRLFLNIEKLLEAGGGCLDDVKYMIVYLRDLTDYEAVGRYMRLRFPRVPYLITEARVCRPEWLIEVECVAVRPLK